MAGVAMHPGGAPQGPLVATEPVGLQLTANAVPEVCRRVRGHPGWDYQPVLQIICLKYFENNTLMLVLSDSVHSVSAVLTAEVQESVRRAGMDIFGFVKLISWIVPSDNPSHIILQVHDMQYLGKPPNQQQIGDPRVLSPSEILPAPVQPPLMQQHQQQHQQHQQHQQQHHQQQHQQHQQHHQQHQQHQQLHQMQPPPHQRQPSCPWQAQRLPPAQQHAQPHAPQAAQWAPPNAAPAAAVAQQPPSVGAHARGAAFGASAWQQAPTGYSPAAPSAARRASGADSQMSGERTLISQITPYRTGRWWIKARVSTKGDIRRFTNARGEGQLFKVELMDGSGEISATFFGKAVDKYYSMLQQGKVYRCSRASVKAGNPRYDTSPVVLTFEEHSSIEEDVDESEVPQISYNFKPLSEIQDISENTYVDVAAVVFCVQEQHTFTSKAGKEMTKREIALWDPSGPDNSTVVEMTLWGQNAVNTTLVEGSVLFIKGGRVSEWNGIKNIASPGSLQTVEASTSQQAAQLKAAFEERQRTRPLPSYKRAGSSGFFSQPKSIRACRDEDFELAPPQPPGCPLDPAGPRTVHRHMVYARATEIQLERAPCYPSCPELVESTRLGAQGAPERRACNKKVTEQGFNCWTCANGHQCQQPVWRYICRVKFSDHTDSFEVGLFDETAKKLFGCDAAEYQQAWEAGKEGGDEAALERLNARLLWRPISLKLKAQKEVWQDEERVKYSAQEISAPDLAGEARRLLSEVKGCVAASSSPGSSPTLGGS